MFFSPTQTVTFTATVDTSGFANNFVTALQSLLPSGVNSVVVTSSVVQSNRRAMRRLLANTVLRIDYLIVSNAFTGVDTLTTFLQSANTLSQLTTALQSSYTGVTVSAPTVTVLSSASSSSSSSSSSSIAIIAGVVGGVGGLLLFCCLGGLLYYYRAVNATAWNNQVHFDGPLPSEPQPEPQQL